MEAQDMIHKVEKGASFHEVTSITSVPPIQNIHSAFQMAEYLNLLVQHDPHDVSKIVQVPEYHSQKPSKSSGTNSFSTGKEQDLWIYEHLRRLPIDLTPLTASLLRECTPESCPEMKAGEWQYICVANHQGNVGEEGKGVMQENHCCAIDYILHTLDSHTALWNSSQAFPSRISIKPGSERYFGTQARRISRIFSHAWYAHREIFEEAEAETSLYKRFLALVKRYDLMNLSLLVIPANAFDVPEVVQESGTQPATSETDSSEPSNPQDKPSAVPVASVITTASEDSGNKPSEKPQKSNHRKQVKTTTDDDDEFRRDRFATPVTATRIDHGIKDILGGGERTVGRGTLGRGRGKGIRKALFAVDVPAEEDEDEVDTHVEHIDVIDKKEANNDNMVSPDKPEVASTTNGMTGKSATANQNGNTKQSKSPQNATQREVSDNEEDRKDEPITTADGIEFNV